MRLPRHIFPKRMRQFYHLHCGHATVICAADGVLRPRLPIHCDAAVGTDDLNFRFQNMYDFPIRIDASSQSDGALTIRIYKVH